MFKNRLHYYLLIAGIMSLLLVIGSTLPLNTQNQSNVDAPLLPTRGSESIIEDDNDPKASEEIVLSVEEIKLCETMSTLASQVYRFKLKGVPKEKAFTIIYGARNLAGINNNERDYLLFKLTKVLIDEVYEFNIVSPENEHAMLNQIELGMLLVCYEQFALKN